MELMISKDIPSFVVFFAWHIHLIGGLEHVLFPNISHILWIIIPIDYHFSEGLKPPTGHFLSRLTAEIRSKTMRRCLTFGYGSKLSTPNSWMVFLLNMIISVGHWYHHFEPLPFDQDSGGGYETLIAPRWLAAASGATSRGGWIREDFIVLHEDSMGFHGKYIGISS